MRDQGDGQLVDPGVTGQGTAGQLRELPVVATRQALPHLADVLLHDVVVVEQPLTGGADVSGPIGGGETVVGLLEDPAGPVQAGKERGPPSGPSPRRQALAGGDLLGPLGQAFGAQQLAPDGPREAVLAGIRSEQGSEEGEGAAGAQGDGRGLGGEMFAGEQGSIKAERADRKEAEGAEGAEVGSERRRHARVIPSVARDRVG
jgi:hypothetical protein